MHRHEVCCAVSNASFRARHVKAAVLSHSGLVKCVKAAASFHAGHVKAAAFFHAGRLKAAASSQAGHVNLGKMSVRVCIRVCGFHQLPSLAFNQKVR